MSLILTLLISISTWASDADSSPLTFPAAQVKSLVVSVPKGKISLSSSKTQKEITVKVIESNKVNKDSKKCVKNIGLENSQLNVKISSENILFEKADCNYDVSILVPASMSLDQDLSSGSAFIAVSDVSGPINLQTATGSVAVSGDVLKNINAKTATGNMSFSYKSCPNRADLDFLSATGKMTLNLPGTCKIRVDYKSATGKLFNALGETKDYQVFINAKSASGDFSIGKQ